LPIRPSRGAHDARIADESRHVLFLESRDLVDVEAFEEIAITFALVQDGRPRKPGLRAFEYEHFEEMAVVA
jgi:hypothetical protein